MLLRGVDDLGPMLSEARRARAWSQQDLADAIDVSRQWVSMVENGKTSVEFDLVIHAFHALGYSVRFNSNAEELPNIRSLDAESADQPSATRTPLTRGGKPLTTARSRRRRTD